jgi:hypothetical protein
MNRYLQIAFAANLKRSADTLERLAAIQAVELSQQDSFEEMQAHVDAGAAVWGAVLAGFLDIPEIVLRVEELRDYGFPEPDTTTDNGMKCSNLFFDAMTDVIYPMGEGVAPYDSLSNYEQFPLPVGDKIRFRQSELKAESTGCRILTGIIETQSERRTQQGEEEDEPVVSANDARDKWIYDEAIKSRAWDSIQRGQSDQSDEWELILTAQGCKAAADRYAKRHHLPAVPPRKSGRPI